MPRFTAVVYDEGEDNTYKRYILTAASADDVKLRLLQWEYEKGVNDKSIERDADLDTDQELELEEEVVDYHLIAVFAGDHPNLITPDEGCEDIIIPDNWKISV